MNQLNPYQEIGAHWLAQRTTALLADDMGLGKTVQAISACDILSVESVLIVCPAAVRVNWKREFDEWSIYPRDFKVCARLADSPGICSIVSYDYLVKSKDKLSKIGFDVVIFDESHYLKSPKTKRAKAALGKSGIVRSAKHVWCLSGTPAPNNPSELWTLLFTFGQTTLSFDDFTKRFCNVVDTGFGIKIDGAKKEAIPELRELLDKIMLRRKKEDVMKELPPISFGNVYLEPGEVDLFMHSSFLRYVYPEDKTGMLADRLIMEERLLTDFFDNHEDVQLTKPKALEAVAASVSTLRRFIGLQKVEPVIKLVTEELENKQYEKIVLFALHRDVIEGLREGLKKYGVVAVYGGTEPHRRQRNIDKFQNDPRCKIFIGNIIAAGTGITLTAAHQVLFVEQDWVPGNNAQAAMRCHRIGQQHPVFVRFAALANSLDERIMRIVKRKTVDLTAIFDY